MDMGAHLDAHNFEILSTKPSCTNGLEEESNYLLSSGSQVRILQGAFQSQSKDEF